jgi:F1F0 ATPase subunit 2
MSDSLTLVLACVAGALLGTIFFGGLWWTIRKTLSSKQPGLWIFGSLLLRMSIALTGIVLVSGSHWERLLLCLVGFFIARFVVTWLTGPSEEDKTRPAKAASHAP